MHIINNKKGITLVSLIITIVIMFILLGIAAVAIPEGIINDAKNTRNVSEDMINVGQNKIDTLKNSLPDISE